MGASITFRLDGSLFVREPEGTALGRSIIAESIHLMDEIGYDAFTFKKLADRIHSTEASVYRYFRNKHQLLCYLVSWYWLWLDYLISIRTINVSDPRRRLELAIIALLEADQDDPNVAHIDEGALHRVVIAESARVYMTRTTEDEQHTGILEGYNLLCSRLTDLIKAIDPKYRYPRELMETLLLGAHNQIFSMYQSQDRKAKRSDRKTAELFLNNLVFTCLNR